MKFVLRSKSFLLRQPFQRKQTSFPATRLSRKNDVGGNNDAAAAAADRKSTVPDLQLPFSSLNLGSNPPPNHYNRPATLGHPVFHLPPSRFLWQKMFFNNNSTPSGPESLPCHWSGLDDGGFSGKSPLSLNHIKQSSFDSGIGAKIEKGEVGFDGLKLQDHAPACCADY